MPNQPPLDDRSARLRQIAWWDQQKIETLRVLVVGCGALGNEVLKNLALLGVRHLVIIDLDRIEPSNLSRSVLFRQQDVGLPKATAAARALRDILPGASIQPITADVIHQVGLGVYRWADLVICGLDNREARLWINRCAWKTGRPWIDGAIEGINGVARVFLPGQPPCYECTLGETDWQLLNRRMSCNLLLQEPEPAGKVPTTPTVSSIIAGIEVQEAVKLIHGLPVLAGRGFVFEGLNHTSYVVQYTENPDCQSHDTLARIVEVAEPSAALTLHQLYEKACRDAGGEVVLEFSRDILHRFVCPRCGAHEEVFAPLGTVAYERGYCPSDGQMRIVETIHSYHGSEGFGTRRLSELGLPLFDLFTARRGEQETGYLIAGDRDRVLSTQWEGAAV